MESCTAFAACPHHGRFRTPVFGNVDGGGIRCVQSAIQVLAEPPSVRRTVVDYRDLVVTESVHVVLLDKEAGIVDQELPYFLLPEGKYRPRVILVGEVQAVVGIGSSGAVKEIDGFGLVLHI